MGDAIIIPKNKNKKIKSNHGCETLPGIPDQCRTPERPRSTQPPTHAIQNQTDQKVKQGHFFTEIRTKKLNQWHKFLSFLQIIS